MRDSNQKLIALVGPTASGKTALGIELARRFNGEVVCCDSRTVYREMSIGTAKPTVAERSKIPHHLLDILDPDEAMSAALFKTLAEEACEQIWSRGRIPMLVGGTGLYLYSVIYNYSFPAGPRTAERVRLESEPLANLVARLESEDPERASSIDLKNPRRVIRALETLGQPRQQLTVLPGNILLLGLRVPSAELNNRIERRTRMMIQQGLVDETVGLLEHYRSKIEPLKSPGYIEIVDYLQGKTSLDEAANLICLHTRQLVKRQQTWFKRNPDIIWLDADTEEGRGGQAYELAKRFLARSQL